MISTVLNKRFVMLPLAAMMSIAAFAQNVVGTVKDTNGEPIIGASVQVKGTNMGAVTDMNGNYSISGVKPGQSLVVTYIGYLTKTIKVGNAGSMNVTLNEDNQALDELIVVGYGTQKKADVTGATARVTSKDLTAMPVKDALQGMQGKTAGVDIQNSQRPGEVGEIQVRGVRSLNADQGPLYVVDGMILQNGGIENLNPQDIESIDVLKDAASTSVYGSRGANGVVLVTTKHGKQGKLSVNYSGSVTMDWVSSVADYMTAAEWLDYARMAHYNAGSYTSTIGEDGKVVPVLAQDANIWSGDVSSWNNIAQAYDANGNYDASKVGSYDWVGNALRTGVTQDHNISFSGGTEKFQGYGSFGYLNQTGSQKGQDYTRYTMKTNFDAQVLPYLKLGTTINAAYGEQEYGYSYTRSTTGAGDYYGAMRGMIPWTVPYTETGAVNEALAGDGNIINYIDEVKYTTNSRKTFNINGNFFAHLDFGKIWKPLEGFTYRIQFGPEFKYYEIGTFNNKNGVNGSGNNVAKWNKYQYRSWVLDNIFQYNRTIAEKHHIGFTFLQSASKYHYDNLGVTATGVAMESELWYNMGSTSTWSVGSGLTETQMTSYMARLTYNYADKYMMTASIRRDGASQLADGHKWATFPSVSFAWRIDQEKFMESTKDWLTSLKLRVGYGVSGNSAISAYATQGAIQSLYQQWGSDVQLGYVGSDASAKDPNKAANNELSWERTGQWNLGLDFSFLNDRIYGSFDYYHTHTTDLLMAKTIPSLTGYTSTFANVGSTVGHGFEFQINAVPVKTKDWKWTLGLTWSADRSYIEELANGQTKDVNNAWFVGEEIGVYYNYVYDGIWKTDETIKVTDANGVEHEYGPSQYGQKVGDPRIKDINGNGKKDTDDRQIVGYKRPRWTAGLTSTLNYKNWEFSFFIYSRMGFDVAAGAMTLDGRYMSRSVDYFVAGYNEDAEYYAPYFNMSATDYTKSQGYVDGSYIKVRNINLGYTFNAKQLKKTKLSTLKIYAQVMNPFSLYRATSWLDTDVVSYDNNTKVWGSTTTSRSLVFGLNVGF